MKRKESNLTITDLRVRLSNGEEAVLTHAESQAVPAWSENCSCVRWKGDLYAFSPKQRAIVSVLRSAAEQGNAWVDGAMLLEAAESDCGKVRDLFRNHPAWGTLILAGAMTDGPPGHYRLAITD